jgi:hypothetical protein
MLRLIFGLCCGIAIGMIVAPARGYETRRRWQQKAGQGRDEKIDQGRQPACDVGSVVFEKLYDRAVGEKQVSLP